MIQHVSDPRLAHFFHRAAPYYWGLWLIVSPLGFRGVPWLADRLHRLRRR
jgi:hypothetical protein